MLKNKTRRSSATPPDRQAKVARTATVRVARVKTAAATATADAATKVIITPLARTVSLTTPMNTSDYLYKSMPSTPSTPSTQRQYKSFIEELNRILTNEKIIDRNDKTEFKELLAEQSPYNKLLYKITPKNIVCFVICNHYEGEESHIFNKYDDYYGDVVFYELLRKNNMGMIWLNYNTLYIHRNI